MSTSQESGSIEAAQEDGETTSAEEKVVTALISSDITPEDADTISSCDEDFRLLEMVYEPLVKYGSGGEIEPALAKSWGDQRGWKRIHLSFGEKMQNILTVQILMQTVYCLIIPAGRNSRYFLQRCWM